MSGHRNEQSIQHYVRDTSTIQKQKMSASISSFTSARQTTDSADKNNNIENDVSAIPNTSASDRAIEPQVDLNESDMELSSEFDNIIAEIKEGESVLQPLTNFVPMEPSSRKMTCTQKAVFHSCQVTIHNLVSS